MLWLHLGKQKEPITQSIRNRRERGSRFKMMFYVIGSEDQSRVLLHTAPANRTKGVVEQFGTSGVPIPCRMNRLIMSQCDRTFIFSCYVAAIRCAIIIQIMCYAVKVANPLTIFGTTENEHQRVQKNSLYLLGHFQEKYQWAKNNSAQVGQNFQNPLPTKLVGSLKPHFCPSWTEVEKLTSTQVVSKSKITSTQLAEKLGCNFYTC